MIDNYLQKRAIYGGFASTTELSAAAVTQVIATPKTGKGFRVQKLTVVVTTGSAGKTWALAGTAGVVLTPALDMSTAGVKHEFDFGPKGVLLAVNDTITLTISAAGAAGKVIMSGYQS